MQTNNFIDVDSTSHILKSLVNSVINGITENVLKQIIPEIQKKNTNNELQYLSAEQVCERFSVTKPTIHEWRKRGIIKCYKLGARVYYRWDELQNAMIIN